MMHNTTTNKTKLSQKWPSQEDMLFVALNPRGKLALYEKKADMQMEPTMGLQIALLFIWFDFYDYWNCPPRCSSSEQELLMKSVANFHKIGWTLIGFINVKFRVMLFCAASLPVDYKGGLSSRLNCQVTKQTDTRSVQCNAIKQLYKTKYAHCTA